jgi:hypothetical protein
MQQQQHEWIDSVYAAATKTTDDSIRINAT